MPIYDFRCTACGHTFEELSSYHELPPCAACGDEHTERQFSFGGGGHAADSGDEFDQEVDGGAAQAEATLRLQDERAWDLERTYEQRHSVHLKEISEKSNRIAALMGQIEELEPLIGRNAELEAQLAQLTELQGITSAAEKERTQELELRTGELESATAEVRTLRGEMIDAADEARTARETLESRLQEREYRISDLEHQVEELRGDLELRTAALFKRDELLMAADATEERLREELRMRDRDLTDSAEDRQELQSNLTSKDEQLQQEHECRQELEQALKAVQAELRSVHAELTETSGALERSEQAKVELERAWTTASGEVEQHRSKFLTSLQHLSATQSVVEELAPMLRSLESILGVPLDDDAETVPSESEA